MRGKNCTVPGPRQRRLDGVPVAAGQSPASVEPRQACHCRWRQETHFPSSMVRRLCFPRVFPDPSLDEDASPPATPAPTKETSAPSRGTQKPRGNAPRGGRYPSRGGARPAPKDQTQNGVDEPSSEPKRCKRLLPVIASTISTFFFHL